MKRLKRAVDTKFWEFKHERTRETGSMIYIQAGEDRRNLAAMEFGFLGDIKACEILFCESGNVYNETGFTPRQLAEQKEELLETLELVRDLLYDQFQTKDELIPTNVVNAMNLLTESIKNS